MKRIFAVVMLCGAAIVFLTTCARSEQPEQIVSPKPAAAPDNVSNGLVPLPPLPQGKTTILGGEIQNVDPVRDQFSLQIYGQRPMKILFDERTQVYRDGVRVPVRDLGPEAHASVQTTLDGASVFAVSIHILSGAPEGECQGRVVKYDPSTGELAAASEISPEPVTLLVPASVSIARVGEPEFTAAPSGVSDLVAGALISVTFESDAARRNVARQIKILAVPGAAFVFNGNISFLDMSTGIMVLVDPREGKSYQIHFDSVRFPASETLRPGANATVTATYDGARYTANEITVN